MSRAKANPMEKPLDKRLFSTLWSEHLSSRIAYMLRAFVYSDPPPFARRDDNTIDFEIWSNLSDSDPKHRRGKWFTDLSASPEEVILMNQLVEVRGQYSKAGVDVHVTTANEIGMWLPVHSGYFKEVSPNLAETIFGEVPMYFYMHYAASALPRDPLTQRDRLLNTLPEVVQEDPRIERRYPRGGLLVRADVFTDNEGEGMRRIHALRQWGVRLCLRRHNAMFAMAFFASLANIPKLTVATALQEFPWIQGIMLSPGGISPLTLQGHMEPMRGDKGLEHLLPTRLGPAPELPHNYGHWHDPTHAVIGIKGAAAHLHPIMVQAVAALSGWTERHPQYPASSLTATWGAIRIPSWIVAWLIRAKPDDDPMAWGARLTACGLEVASGAVKRI